MVLNNIDYHICDTCNLNCVSCNHFSPLATNANKKTVEDVKIDFQILKKWEKQFKTITLLGGEPLLNENIRDIIKIANENFPDKVKLITNGVLYQKLIDLKYDILDNSIKLVITEYPFKENWIEHYNNLRREFPEAEFYEFRVEHGFLKDHLSYNKTNIPNETIYKCDKRLKCCNYVNGKLFICHYAAFLPFLNSITPVNINNNDSFIDLTTCTLNEFDDFFTKQIPNICKQCLYVTKSYDEHEKQIWKRSIKNPNEWIQ